MAFCPRCEINMNLHDDPDDCEEAEQRVSGLERIESLFWSVTGR